MRPLPAGGWEVAYSDIRSAFQYYLRTAGQRPLVLAGHSQGGVMVQMLCNEFLTPGSQLLSRLVAVYAPGIGSWAVPTVPLGHGVGCAAVWNTATPTAAVAETLIGKYVMCVAGLAVV